MRAEDTSPWKFDGPVRDDSVVVCPKCGEGSPLSAWDVCDVYCEVCEYHAAMVCPKCHSSFDHVRPVTFVVRNA